MELLHTTCMGNNHKHPPLIEITDNRQSTPEKLVLFSTMAQVLVSDMLLGKVEVFTDDIKLETSTWQSEAIHISERLSSNAEFRKMWATTSCLSMLKKLAQTTLKQ